MHKGDTTHTKMRRGEKIAAEMRAAANTLTESQREESLAFAMQVIYGKGKKAGVHATRH